MLRIEQVSKTFFPGTINERVALNTIDLHLQPGDFTTVIGSNGAGKSTLLNVISGKMFADEGDVFIDGKSVKKLKDFRRARYIGRVFQDPMAGTSPNLTIEQNLSIAERRGQVRGLGLAVNDVKRAKFVEELKALDLGLEHRLKAKVGLLSGGQRQALSLLMATFTHPKILLLDEHTAALDPQRAELVTRLTMDVVERNKLTTLMVTHNMEQALRVGNRLIMMHEGEIILSLDAEQKKSATIQDLLGRFESIKGAALDDRTLLN